MRRSLLLALAAAVLLSFAGCRSGSVSSPQAEALSDEIIGYWEMTIDIEGSQPPFNIGRTGGGIVFEPDATWHGIKARHHLSWLPITASPSGTYEVVGNTLLLQQHPRENELEVGEYTFTNGVLQGWSTNPPATLVLRRTESPNGIGPPIAEGPSHPTERTDRVHGE